MTSAEQDTTPFVGSQNGGRDLDHHSADYRESWPQIYDEIRESGCPMAHSTHYDGFYIASRYDDVAEVARDDDTYSSAHDLDPSEGNRGGIVIPPVPVRSIPIEIDPPRLKQFRKILTKPLSPQAAQAWEPWIRNLTTYFIDQIIEKGDGDLVLDIGNPVPAIFTMHFLGLPLNDWEQYAMPMHQVVYASPGTKELEEAFMGILAFMNNLSAAIEDRRDNPRGDFISEIAQSEIDGAPMSHQEAIETAFLVVAGGVDTTTGLLSTTLDWLDEHPDERDHLAKNPELIPRATDEFLRYMSPVQGNARTVTQKCVLNGQELEDGDRILISWAAANRDPEVFENPHEVDLARFPNRHQAFGMGMHRCAGSNVARVLFGVMLEEILRRMPDYRIDRQSAEPYADIATVNGWKRQPCTFSPGARENAQFPDENERV